MEPGIRSTSIRFYEIDLLRFLAALSVVIFHFTYRGYAADNYSPIPFLEMGCVTRYGYLGVELFFIISGYVVLRSAQGKTVRQFFLSRITRLYPAFWVACTLTFMVERIWGKVSGDTHMSDNLHSSFGQYAYNLTMLHEFFGVTALDGAYWSLTLEITFYFLISLLISYNLLRHIEWVLAGWLAYAAWVGPVRSDTMFFHLFFPHYAMYFAAGMLFYLLQYPSKKTFFRYCLLFACYALAVRASIFRAYELSNIFHDDISRKIVVIVITFFFIIIYLISSRKLNLSRFTWLSSLGALTYPLYLIHSDIAYVVFHRFGATVNKYILLISLIASMLIIAYAIHRYVEKRFSRSIGEVINSWMVRLDSH
jgi:peptidoglycan/LPS O-acetylase OafA/YrhL